MSSIVRAQSPQYSDRNAFVYALLGLLCTARRVRGTIDVAAEAPNPEPTASADELFVLALLGARSLSLQIDSTISNAAPPVVAPPSERSAPATTRKASTADDPPRRPRPRDLLR